jgi:hypothetical protein
MHATYRNYVGEATAFEVLAVIKSKACPCHIQQDHAGASFHLERHCCIAALHKVCKKRAPHLLVSRYDTLHSACMCCSMYVLPRFT